MNESSSARRTGTGLALFFLAWVAACLVAPAAWWGLGSGGWFPRPWLGLAVVMAAMAFHPGADTLVARLARGVGANPKLWVPVGALVFTTFAWLTPVRFPLLGDQVLWLRTLALTDSARHLMEPLSYSLANAARGGAQSAAGLPELPARLFTLFAVLYASGAWFLGAAVTSSPAGRGWLWFVMLTLPQTLLFHGYVESYGLLLVFLVWTAAGLLHARRVRGYILAWMFGVLTAAAHLQGLGVVFVLWLGARSRRRAVVAAAGTVIVVLGALAWTRLGGDSMDKQHKSLAETLAFLMPHAQARDGFLSGRRWFGLLQVLLLLGGPALWVLPGISWRDGWRERPDAVRVLGLLGVGGLAGLGLVRLSLGPLRDWDLFAAYVTFLPVLSGMLFLLSKKGSLPRFAAAFLVLSLVHGLAWNLVDGSEARGLARARGVMSLESATSPEARALAADELAYLARQRNDVDDAIAWYTVAIEAKPFFWRYHFNRALLELRSGDQESAERSLLTALDRNPTSNSPYRTLGGLYLQTNRQQQALEVFNLGLEQTGPSPHLYFGRGAALAMTGRLSESFSPLDSSLAMDPRNAEVAAWATQFAVQAKDAERARRYLRVWAQAPPPSAEEWRRLVAFARAVNDTSLVRAVEQQLGSRN